MRRAIPLFAGRAVYVQFGGMFLCELRCLGERDEAEVAAFVAGRAVGEVKIRMADLAVEGCVAVVLGLEVDDTDRGVAPAHHSSPASDSARERGESQSARRL